MNYARVAAKLAKAARLPTDPPYTTACTASASIFSPLPRRTCVTCTIRAGTLQSVAISRMASRMSEVERPVEMSAVPQLDEEPPHVAALCPEQLLSDTTDSPATPTAVSEQPWMIRP